MVGECVTNVNGLQFGGAIVPCFLPWFEAANKRCKTARTAVTNLFKPKITDLHLGGRQYLPIEASRENESADFTSKGGFEAFIWPLWSNFQIDLID